MTSGIFGTGGRASASTDPITIVSAGSPATSVGELTIVADTTVPITAMTAHLWTFNVASPTDVFDPVLSNTGTTKLPSGQLESTWSVASPITEGQLPLGNYQINLDVTFNDNTTANPTAVGYLSFVDELTISLTADHTEVSYDNQVVTLSGNVTSLNPEGVTSLFANKTVTMASSLEPNVELSTDVSGNFRFTVRPHDGDWVEVEADINSTAAGTSAPVNFTAHIDPVRIAVKLSTRTVIYGGNVTATGSVTYEPGSTFVPFPHRTVQMVGEELPNGVSVKTTTDSNGHFSVVLPSIASNTMWTFNAGGASGDPYLGPATVSLPLTVNLPVAVTGFRMTLNPFWQLSYSGCVGLARPVPGNYVNAGLNGPVYIQYAPTPHGPWLGLTHIYPDGGSCGINGERFSGVAIARVNYSYYRAYVRPQTSNQLLVPGYTAATSGAVLAWKYADRIVSLSVSPHVVPSGGNLTVSGQLQYYYRTWHAYASQQILIIFRPQGSSTWYWIVKVKTNSAGRFSATFQDPGSATWSALYEGNSTHLAASPPGIYVRVAGAAVPASALRPPWSAVRYPIDMLPLTSSLWPNVTG
jgi:hypothetical protein